MLESLLNKKIQSDIWGDLGYIRQSIGHKDSIGTDQLKNARIITDFKPGQEVIFTHQIMEKIHKELNKWYTEFLINPSKFLICLDSKNDLKKKQIVDNIAN